MTSTVWPLGDGAALEHAQGGAVGDGQRGELDVGERGARRPRWTRAAGTTTYSAKPPSRSLPSTSTGRASGPASVVVGGIHEHPRRRPARGSSSPRGDHGARRRRRPGCAGSRAGPASPPRASGSSAGAVGALAGPEVGVVAARGADAHQHLVGPRDGAPGRCAYVDHVEPAVAGDDRGPHGLGRRRRGRLGRLRRSRGHGSSMAPRHGPGRSRAVDRGLIGSAPIDIL